MLLVRLLLIVFVSALFVLGQEPLYTLRVDVPLVSLEVAAFDAGGRAVTTLTREDFQVYENGALQEIRNFAPVSTPYNILLLFDRSGSTQGQWPFMQRAVARFLDNLRPQDQVAIAAFDNEFEMLVDWTSTRREAVVSLSELIRPRQPGATDLYGSVDRAVRRQFRSVRGRKAVIVFSDGRDTSLYRQTLALERVPGIAEDRNFTRMVRDIEQSETPLYFVAMNTDRNLDLGNGGGNDYTILRRIYPQSSVPRDFLVQVRTRMERLSDVSGGRIFFPEKLEDVAQLYNQISRELGTSYSLGYIPVNAASSDGKYRRIEVRVEDAVRVWQSRTGYDSQK
jgi:VWFA-related protein